MESRIAKALKLKHGPIAILWTDRKPREANQFAEGKWGCVMSAFGATVEKGRPHAFDKKTFGCFGGGTGLGFGNQYENFVGGIEGFSHFLSDGSEKCPVCKKAGDQCAFLRGRMREDYMKGEGYKKTAELTRKFVDGLPVRQVPNEYVVFKRLADVNGDEQPVVVVFLADPDQTAALVTLANYSRPGMDAATIPFASGCQAIGILPYQEAEKDDPRAVVGMMDPSARVYLRRLGKDLVTFAVPFKMFVEMESNVGGSFLEKDTWKELSGGQ